MELKNRIVKYILANPGVKMDTIIDVATSKGYTQHEILVAIDSVHKDKRITYTANASGVVVYKPATVKVSTIPTHISWLTTNYPWPPSDWQECWPEIDLSHLFLKTKEERDAYQALATGRPIWQKHKYK